VNSVYANIKSCEFEVIIVNNSPEEDLSFLSGKYNSLKIYNNSNLGFSQANNFGADKSSGEYLFFLNPDTVVKEDIFKNIFNHFGRKKFGAVGFKLYYPDGTFQNSFGLDNNLKNEKINKECENKFNARDLDFIKKTEEEYKNIKEVNWVSGAAMMVRKSAYKEIGGFDEKFFLYYEDADLCRRFRESGYPNYFYPFSNIIHYKGENTGDDFIGSSYYHSKKSQLLYYKKHNSCFQNISIRFYLFIKFLFKYLAGFNKANLNILCLTFKRN
jgi:GT2 family glycosyltransferase